MEIGMENYDDIDAKPRSKSKFNLAALLGSIAPIGLIIVTIIYISIFQKEAVSGFLKKYDVVGISSYGKAEKNRLYKINNLPIPFEQRQALKQGTIFLGASTEMVELALGAPHEPVTKEADGREKWVYFFKENSRPTYLFFEDGRLTDAAKGSTVDNAEIQ